MQDVRDQELMDEYMRPRRAASPGGRGAGSRGQQGFVVTGAPWDVSSQQDFPDLGATAGGPQAKVSWGPAAKR